MKLPFAQIDAFATRAFTGNPAAVLLLDEWLDDSVLQAIAAENNLSETAFLVADRNEQADYLLRWFTPTVEVALCGHATLASGHYVLRHTDFHREWVRFMTRKAGVLEVREDDHGLAMALPAYPPETTDIAPMVAALGVTDPVDTLWHPNGYGVVVLADEAAVLAVAPDFAALAAIGDTLNIVTAPGESTDLVSRVFAPAAGIDEDPVTGSAHAVIAPYWAERLGRNRFTALQASQRRGDLDCEVDGARVILRGACVTVIEGSFEV
ncbi:PhzF family phenazine biosynthesis protein [Sphingomonas sp. S1-29]|uniref:PhzF family phenazine biosynthesis protein n=1 Tax=Sphingomonas sp. S1-29 TaxID=2991074 RepID=UPI00223EF0F6|nr:PhzF family phenazine biosynthesis protein [Sphingomonas sp. S1-29]UZK68395.1 PhzF family phenazine biosynthesis protein [Sphingomonas sp. S1-29]